MENIAFKFDGHIRAQLTVRKSAGLDVHGQQVASGQACLPADDPQVLPFPTHCAARQPRDGWQLTMTLLAGLRRTCTGSSKATPAKGSARPRCLRS
jgi:hypothetical protein